MKVDIERRQALEEFLSLDYRDIGRARKLFPYLEFNTEDIIPILDLKVNWDVGPLGLTDEAIRSIPLNVDHLGMLLSCLGKYVSDDEDLVCELIRGIYFEAWDIPILIGYYQNSFDKKELLMKEALRSIFRRKEIFAADIDKVYDGGGLRMLITSMEDTNSCVDTLNLLFAADFDRAFDGGGLRMLITFMEDTNSCVDTLNLLWELVHSIPTENIDTKAIEENLGSSNSQVSELMRELDRKISEEESDFSSEEKSILKVLG